MIDDGNPVGISSTVHSDGSVTNDVGGKPARGYSWIEASDLGQAVSKAEACRILQAGGSVDLVEALDM